MIASVNHVSFTVSDLDKSISFYKDVLGMECVSVAERDEAFSSAVTGIEGVKLRIAYMVIVGFAIELIQYISGEGIRIDTSTNNIGSAHLCFHIEDYDAWLNRMNSFGVKICGDICVVPAGPNKGRRVCYAVDVDGNHIEFIESQTKQI